MATVLEQALNSDCLPSFANGFAEEWAVYKQALRRVAAVAPETLPLRCGTPLDELDAAAVALANAAWMAGSRVGDAFARAERSLVGEYAICTHCDGEGTRPAAGDDDAPGMCVACGGRGLVSA